MDLRQTAAKERGSKKARALLVGIAVAATAVGIGAVCSSTPGAAVQFTIRRGSSFREAAESLSAHGLVRSSARAFAWYATRCQGTRSLPQMGDVRGSCDRALSWEQMLDALRLGRGVIHVITFPEGLAISDIEPMLMDALDLTKDSLDAAVRDTAPWLHRLDVPTPTLEGYLFPDTYTFPDKTSARDAVRMMVERFEHEWKPEWSAQAATMKLTRHDIVTLASIVEREVRRDEERPVVAAVYLNRLKIGMPLMADPTISYALGKKPGRVLLKDLRVKSPYNTYQQGRLPPRDRSGRPAPRSIVACHCTPGPRCPTGFSWRHPTAITSSGGRTRNISRRSRW